MAETVEPDPPAPSFAALGLAEPLVAALADVGYEAPTPIQARAIPPLLAGRDLLGQAQTGTGKTAAFALPILHNLEAGLPEIQALILTPTRELALQVSEAVHTYARRLGGVRVLPVYGGQPMPLQLRRLRAGVHVVVGTPGRVLDHLGRGTLDLSGLRTVVLDEADEMLRMGFIDDVEAILSRIPGPRQTVLFSATIPKEIRRIAGRHLTDPVTVEIEHGTVTVPSVAQRYLRVAGHEKLEALTRLLEVESPEAALVFVRTRQECADVADRLQARGYSAEAMHGDMTQVQRESVIRRLREGQVEVVVATDVAARGLDVERISHVVNYDVPYDPGTYVHRIGRTARAGRAGTAVLFVGPRETRMLALIQRYTGRRIEPMTMPSAADVTARRVARFKDRLRQAVARPDLAPYLAVVKALAEEGPFEMADIAAAAARLARGDQPLEAAPVTGRGARPAPPAPRPGKRARGGERRPAAGGRVQLFMDAGRRAGVRAADVVGAIASEAGIPGEAIGPIDIQDRFTLVEIPAEHRDRVLERMRKVRLRRRPVHVKLAAPRPPAGKRPAARRRPPRPAA